MKLAVLVFSFLSCSFLSVKAQQKPNILFIGIDDLRPELGCYGSDEAISPNLDHLASQGLLFNKAYCQQAICGPSRASLLTGYRPETSGVFHNYIKFREANPDVITLPQQFKNNGYETVYFGKIFHHGDLDDQLSWSIPSSKERGPGGYQLAENIALSKKNLKDMTIKYGAQAKLGLGSGPAYEFADVPDDGYGDGFNTNLAIGQLKELVKNKDKPFFLGLGFHKPHLNWTAPKKYWDLYDEKNIHLSTQVNGPKDGATMGLHASFELRTRYDIPKEGDISPEQAIKLKHAYLACVSYVDAQIGKMIGALEDAGVRDNTIIIVWSDHGWHLGEMGIWGKATDYEIATRVPLMIWTPDMPKGSRGKTSEALVELVDMYPTLCELAGIETPKHVEGQSFVPLLKQPNKKWKAAAFSQFPDPALREWGAYPLRDGMRETFFEPLIEKVEQRIIDQQKEKWNRDLFENDLMGYTMRTQRYRLIVWKDTKHPKEKPLYVELYDHKKDPTETVNIASANPKEVNQLLKQFEKGWKGNQAK
ncbi:iduronate-2-sulfatase [Flavobacterium faecale]|uniref:Iduronate-2-sulfatase n=1 Tax=Flavobacterium faecale TaxID=1355330 RepID=A0A2S1LIF0_9FLAO|nr:sulfatase [Flavobacterium faecale]AWG23256.1 iduronate-2-sulfatase [Flavobacterium faecale]